MHRFAGWIVVASTALLIGAAAWVLRPSLPRVSLPDGSELRILQVDLGTNHGFSHESFWKQALRRALPRSWERRLGPLPGERFRTSHNSLVVWVMEGEQPGVRGGTASLDHAGAVFPDGTVVAGQVRRGQRGVLGLRFDWFPRDQPVITLQAGKGARVRFVVSNPRPVRATNWIGGPLPQTNRSSRTEIVLRELRRSSPGGGLAVPIRSRPTGDGRIGWTTWRVTAVDSLGNWAQSDWAYHQTPRVALGRIPESTWKLIVEGREYLPAGFIPHPARGICRVLPTNPRAQNLGVRFIAQAGPGTHRFVCARSALNTSGPEIPPDTASLTFSGPASETDRVLELKTPEPGILCLMDTDPGMPVVHARLRERVGSDDGRIFRSSAVVSATNAVNGRTQVARFFASRLPEPTTNLEVEIIATLPPATFFIGPPEPSLKGGGSDSPARDADQPIPAVFSRSRE